MNERVAAFFDPLAKPAREIRGPDLEALRDAHRPRVEATRACTNAFNRPGLHLKEPEPVDG